MVIDPRDTPLEHKSIMTERECERLREYGYGIIRRRGAEAIQDLLETSDLEKKLLNQRRAKHY